MLRLIRRQYFNYLPTEKFARLSYVLFIVYFLALSWLITRSGFLKRTGIDTRYLILLFALKAAAGTAIGWMSLHYYGPGNDYWDVNREGWIEYRLLITDPGEYFRNFFRSDYPGGYSGIFDSFQSFWNDLRNNLVIKMVSIFNLFSQGNYYVNSLFFNFIVFFGHAALYRVFMHRFPGQQVAVFIGSFLLPSTLYFSSGIQKDGIVFLLLSGIIYILYFAMVQRSVSWKRICLLFFFVVLLFLFRNYACIVLVPAIVAWILSTRLRIKPLYTYLIVFGLAAVMLFGIHSVIPSVDPLQTIVQKQTDYMGLSKVKSATVIEMDTLQANAGSFIQLVPQALNHAFIRPYLFELPSPILLPMNIELLVYQLLLIMLIFGYRRNNNPDRGAFIGFLLFFCLVLFLFIGYIVPNLGSLVRYRSVYLPLLITPLICSIDWVKWARVLKLNK